MIPTSSPNARQKQWLEAVVKLGSVVSGGPSQIHHCVGRKAKHNKIAIGHWWIIPLTHDEHLVRLHGQGETFGYESRKAFEKDKFLSEVYRPLRDRLDIVPPVEVIQAITDYHR